MSVLVSVIMPVYNMEKLLALSVGDVLSQTYRDFELILVDDASPDNSPALCDAFAKEDNRIRVLHLPENKGVWNARNEGLLAANGEYILFVDSDDRITPDLLSLAVNSATKTGADMVIFGLIEEYFDKNGKIYKTNTISLEEKVLKEKQDVRKEFLYLEETGVLGYPWNKLFSAELLKKSGAKFPQMAFNEDIIFNIDAISFAESCTILPITPYRYAKRSGSTTGKFIPTYYEDIMVKIDTLYSKVCEWNLGEDGLRLVASRYARYFFSALERSYDKRGGFKTKTRKEFFDKELTLPRYKALSPYMAGGGLSGIMAKKFKTGNRFSCLLIARIIYFIKKNFPKIFEKIN